MTQLLKTKSHQEAANQLLLPLPVTGGEGSLMITGPTWTAGNPNSERMNSQELVIQAELLHVERNVANLRKIIEIKREG